MLRENPVHELKIGIIITFIFLTCINIKIHFLAESIYISLYHFVCKLQRSIDPHVGQYKIIHCGENGKEFLYFVKWARSRYLEHESKRVSRKKLNVNFLWGEVESNSGGQIPERVS